MSFGRATRQANGSVGISENKTLLGDHRGTVMKRSVKSFYGIIGKSHAMQEVFELIRRAARTDISVLITGESGTGKELVARAIHYHSPRRKGIYVPCNTGAILPNLVASTLFGYERGAFTGAIASQKGLFELADGGTLFLDEISSADQEMQVALLRVLESKTIRRIGAMKTKRVNTRIIAASNQNLKELVTAGRFRQDLFYRLEVFSIHLPRLEDRPEDIPLLVHYFLDKYKRQFSRSVRGITRDAMRCLEKGSWPGNVRELENTIQRALVMTDEMETISKAQLPRRLTKGSRRIDRIVIEPGMCLDDVQKKVIEYTLQMCGGNKAETARMLGITRKTLYNKLLGYGIGAPF